MVKQTLLKVSSCSTYSPSACTKFHMICRYNDFFCTKHAQNGSVVHYYLPRIVHCQLDWACMKLKKIPTGQCDSGLDWFDAQGKEWVWGGAEVGEGYKFRSVNGYKAVLAGA